MKFARVVVILSILILTVLLGFGLYLILHNNVFASEAVITPISPSPEVGVVPTAQPSLDATPQAL